jgi:hypothetical protein
MLASRFVLLIVINAKIPARAVKRAVRKGYAISTRILTLDKKDLPEYALLAFYNKTVLQKSYSKRNFIRERDI